MGCSQRSHEVVQTTSRNGLKIGPPGCTSMQIELGADRGLSQAPPGAGVGREAAQNQRLPILPPPTKQHKAKDPFDHLWPALFR